jgi:hypothetical protein
MRRHTRLQIIWERTISQFALGRAHVATDWLRHVPKGSKTHDSSWLKRTTKAKLATGFIGQCGLSHSVRPFELKRNVSNTIPQAKKAKAAEISYFFPD